MHIIRGLYFIFRHARQHMKINTL